MTPIDAIAEREGPQNFHRAAGILCYESFTLNGLFARGRLSMISPVMTGRKTTPRTATRSAFAVRARSRRTISAAPQFSAQNMLGLSPAIRPLKSDVRHLFPIFQLPSPIFQS